MKEAKSAKSNQHQQQYNHQNVHLSPSKLANLFDPDASWDKDQLGDVLHWIRQVVGLICGLLWGSIPLVGGIWILVFVNGFLDVFSFIFFIIICIAPKFMAISSGIVYGYYSMILKVDEEDFGGHAALLQEGLFASVTLFLLAWILVYSLAHF